MTELENFFVGIECEFGFHRWKDDEYGSYDKNDFDKVTSIPTGFTNSCWHNDACPSLSTDWNELKDGNIESRIWIESADEMKREVNWGTQFSLDVDCDGIMYSYHSDDWQDILDHAPKAIELQKLIVEYGSSEGFDKYADKAKEYGFKYQ